jgi:SAM-dependent methyltransferase
MTSPSERPPGAGIGASTTAARVRGDKWPKTFPPLTPDQEAIRDDFMCYWHEVLPKKYRAIERFNHGYVVAHAPTSFRRTLEIGAGLGEHLAYERLTPAQRAEYVALELRPAMVAGLSGHHPDIQARVGDCETRLDFPDGHFERVLAVHVLEHLRNLPAAVREVHRVCDKKAGLFQVVIPCEGGLAYSLARRVSAQSIFEKRYGQPYGWFIEREHVSQPHEILEELAECFTVEHRAFFPLRVPLVQLNLCIGLTLRPR